MTQQVSRLTLAATLLTLASCSGGGSGDGASTGTTGNSAPTVNAGTDQEVVEGANVQLNATASDADGDMLSLSWTQVSGPTVSLSDSSAEDPSFTAPDVDTTSEIVLRLTASDGTNGNVSDDVTVTVTDSSDSVEAGYGRIVTPGTTVSLDATVASGTISWNQLEGTAVTLSDSNSEDPSFTAPTISASETLVFELTVDTGTGTPATDQVSVEVWVSADSSSNLTVVGDYTGRTGWNCTVDPVETPSVEITQSGSTLTVESNAIPNHATGTFPNTGNPNTVTALSKSWTLDASPELASSSTEMAEFGVTLDGVKLERDTAESYQNAGVWRYEAVTPGLANKLTSGAEFTWLGTDCNNAHVQPTGEYHYHGPMEGLTNRLGETNGAPDDMILGGYAADGFPFYLRYGYVDADDPLSGLTALEGSWEVRSGTRTSGPGGAYDGTFRADWEYVDGSGDLDECNGRFGPTPEYPDGIYHYYITDDYPYIPRCVMGTPSSSFRSMR